jgi:aminoglycoside phosphotransferase (APT) family kinase protein
METANQEMSAAGRDVLELVLRSLQDVESRWGEIDEISAAMVPTLVHGDFVPKNVRVKRGRARSFSL